METTETRIRARQLVEMLRDMSADPDAPAAEALPAWRAEAAAHGDHRLVAELDAYDHALLAQLWDGGCGYLCPRCSARDPWSLEAQGCPDCARIRELDTCAAVRDGRVEVLR